MELIRPGTVPYWLDNIDTALISRHVSRIVWPLACTLPVKSEPFFPVTVSLALLTSTGFTRALMLHCVLFFFNTTQNSTVISLFCRHSSWNKISFVSRGHFAASKPKAMQENGDKTERQKIRLHCRISIEDENFSGLFMRKWINPQFCVQRALHIHLTARSWRFPCMLRTACPWVFSHTMLRHGFAELWAGYSF